MDAVDSTTSSGPTHPETHHGRHEVERGMAKLTGGAGATGPPPRHPDRVPRSASGAGATTADPTTSSAGAGTSDGSPSVARGQEGNVLGPSSAMTAGFTNAGPESAVAEAPYQQQYSAGGAGVPGATVGGEMSNERDFGYGAGATSASNGSQGGSGAGSAGPAPDRYAFGGDGPRHLG
ncbi:hypothetical protein C8Q80DRAFT_759904 [Daedaleopsis nitida]|nr:hypothetical protein C8Q80DRAFT_759904 [Daedaleopsis nitida]